MSAYFWTYIKTVQQTITVQDFAFKTDSSLFNFSLSNNNCGSDCKNDGTSLPLRVNTTGTMRRCGSSLIASLKLMPHPTLSPLLHVGPNARPCAFDLNSLQNTDQYKQRFQKKMFVFINRLSAANSGLTGVIAVLNSTMGILCISRQPL